MSTATDKEHHVTTSTSAIEPTTHTLLDVPGAVLTYDVRSNDAEHASRRCS